VLLESTTLPGADVEDLVEQARQEIQLARELIDDVLVRGELVESGFLRRQAVDTLIAEERTGREDRSKHIWQLLTLEFWYRQTRRAGVGL